MLTAKIFGNKEFVSGNENPYPIFGVPSIDQAGLYLIHLELLNVENYLRSFVFTENDPNKNLNRFEPKSNLFSSTTTGFNLIDHLPDKPKFKKLSGIWKDMG